jgi:hypothetical protein
MGFLEDLAAAKAAVEGGDRVVTPPIEVTVNGQVYSLLFIRSASAAWSEACIKHPPRLDVELDKQWGYNLSAVSLEVAAESARVLDDGEEIRLSAEQWADLFDVMPGRNRRMIEATVWHLNEREPELEIARAKKASRRAPRKKQS